MKNHGFSRCLGACESDWCCSAHFDGAGGSLQFAASGRSDTRKRLTTCPVLDKDWFPDLEGCSHKSRTKPDR